MSVRCLALALVTVAAACHGAEGATSSSGGATDAWQARFTELMDPETCKECHPNHVEQWSGSMHAYAAEDPVFLAMNARGQRETNGELGDFCVKCHAPLAVELGATEDGLNLGELPAAVKGVNCYFCHNVNEVTQDHNNGLSLAFDNVMRGGVIDPVATKAHESAYSPMLDGNKLESSRTCGVCHDIITPAGVHLERTYVEYLATFYAQADPANPDVPATHSQRCNSCHMSQDLGYSTIATAEGAAGNRIFHKHYMPGPDVALTPFVGEDDQAREREALREGVLCAQLCVTQDGETVRAKLWLHNEAAGHRFPSGAIADRRFWLEVVAQNLGETVFESGVEQSGEPINTLNDPNLWLITDPVEDANGQPAHMFWDVRKSPCLEDPDNDSCGLNLASEPGCGPDAPMWRSRDFEFAAEQVTDITVRGFLRPVGLDVLQDLVDSGDLDPAIKAAMPTHQVDLNGLPDEKTLHWTFQNATLQDDGSWCVAKVDTCVPPTPRNCPEL